MPISDAKHRANERYNAKAYDEIKLRVKKGRKEEIQIYAESRGESVTGFINRAIDEQIERDREEQQKDRSKKDSAEQKQ